MNFYNTLILKILQFLKEPEIKVMWIRSVPNITWWENESHTVGKWSDKKVWVYYLWAECTMKHLQVLQQVNSEVNFENVNASLQGNSVLLKNTKLKWFHIQNVSKYISQNWSVAKICEPQNRTINNHVVKISRSRVLLTLNFCLLFYLQAVKCCMEGCTRTYPVLQDALVHTVKQTVKSKQTN